MTGCWPRLNGVPTSTGSRGRQRQHRRRAVPALQRHRADPAAARRRRHVRGQARPPRRHATTTRSRRAQLRTALLVGELRHAIEAGELELHYQPKVRMSDGRLCGVEALVRWRHPTRGLLLPGQVHPRRRAERPDRPAHRRRPDRRPRPAEPVARGRARRCRSPSTSARRCLLDRACPPAVARLLDRFGADAADLTIEITESAHDRRPGPGQRGPERAARARASSCRSTTSAPATRR